MNCPNCNAPVSIESNCGNDVGPVRTMDGRVIESLYFGCCFECWKKFDVVDGEIARVWLFPVPNFTNAQDDTPPREQG